MLRVVVESAKGLPKKKLGSPDPIATVIFKGKLKKKILYFEFIFELDGIFKQKKSSRYFSTVGIKVLFKCTILK